MTNNCPHHLGARSARARSHKAANWSAFIVRVVDDAEPSCQDDWGVVVINQNQEKAHIITGLADREAAVTALHALAKRRKIHGRIENNDRWWHFTAETEDHSDFHDGYAGFCSFIVNANVEVGFIAEAKP
jgi:hypothetical protein